ncbi:MAG: hypothetical protein KF729_29855 [Sandaracinaceae bacterium]|nr:hypothetical protein [Sandaracinaceae bacterium]
MCRSWLALAASALLAACGGGHVERDAGPASDAASPTPDLDASVSRDGATEDAEAPLLAIPPPGEPMPEELSTLGVAVTDEEESHPAIVEYEPSPALWTNGSEKRRLLYLPPDTQIVGQTVFQFPIGTTFFKELSYGGVRVETRVMRLLEEGWEYNVYLWEGEETRLLDASVPVEVEVETEEGTLVHVVPSRRDCRTCHESNADTEVIGFDALRLGEQLDALTERGVFAARPVDAPPIVGRTSLETQVMAYVYGNCVHCHNGERGPSRAFDMRPAVFVEHVVDIETTGSGAPRGLRVASGDPDASVLYVALSRQTPFTMPPLGVQRTNDTVLGLVHDWISSLPSL